MSPSVFGQVFAWSYDPGPNLTGDNCDPTLGWPLQLTDVGYSPLVYEHGIVLAAEDGWIHHYQVPATATVIEWGEYGADPGNTGVQSGPLCGSANRNDGGGALGVDPVVSSGSQRLSFDLAAGGRTHIRIFDASGREVRRLFEGELSAGRHEFRWDAKDSGGRRLPSGVYYYRVVGPSMERSTRTVVVR